MTDFFLWRGCDISGTGTREAILRNRDFVDRAISIMGPEDFPGEDSGLPADPTSPTTGGSTPCSTVSLLSAQWVDIRNTGLGTLAPGTYSYQLVPVDTCTGRTCSPIPLPDLTITTLGEQATLALEVDSSSTCDSYFVQRNGVIVGPLTPVEQSLIPSASLIVPADTAGTFTNFDNDAQTFTAAGAPLEAGDLVRLDNPPSNPHLAVVTNVTGSVVTFNPRVPDTTPDVRPQGWFDPLQRLSAYYQTSPPDFVTVPIIGLRLPAPFAVNVISPSLFEGGLKLLDLVTYGLGTALVVAVEGIPPLQKVGLLPLSVTIPLPAGILWLVHRNAPSLGLDNGFGGFSGVVTVPRADPDPPAPANYQSFRVAATAGTPNDAQLVVGATLVITSGAFVGAATIKAIDDFNGGDSDIRIVLTGDSSVPFATFAGTGLYAVLPQGISNLLGINALATSGTYERLSRTTEDLNFSNVALSIEDGRNQVRSGRLDGAGTDALALMRDAMTLGGYPGGLSSFRQKVTGPCGKALTLASKTFNQTMGAFTLPSITSTRFYAVNEVAKLGVGPFIDANLARERRALFDGKFATYSSVADQARQAGVVVTRYQEKVTNVPAADCPPGQPNTTITELVYKGVATTTSPLRSDEKARVLWSPTGRFATQVRAKLRALGLTDDEASSALTLSLSGRLLSVIELSDSETTTDDLIDDILDDDRIRVIDTGKVLPGQVTEAIRRRGVGGLIKRPVCTSPDEKVLIEDVETVALNVTNLCLLYQASFDICDVDTILAAIPDAATRTAVGSVFAICESTLGQLQGFGEAMRSFLTNPDYEAAKEFIASAVNAFSADPTLGCLFGPALVQSSGVGLPTFPSLNVAFAGIQDPLILRFNILTLAMQNIRSIICTVLNELLGLVPGDVRTAARTAIGCLPSLDALAALPGFDIEIQIGVTCFVGQITLYSDLINEVLSEIAEFLNFLALGDGFFRSMGATNLACSSDDNFASVFQRARDALGITDIPNAAAGVANQVGSFFGGIG